MDPVSVEVLRKMADTHVIVAALVATVTFTAGLTVPGGFYGSDGRYPGTAILTKETAFKSFVISNAIALMLSFTSMLLYFDAARCNQISELKKTYRIASLGVTAALMAMMIAFVTGTYAVLDHSPALAISTCALGSSVVALTFLYVIRYFLEWFYNSSTFLILSAVSRVVSMVSSVVTTK